MSLVLLIPALALPALCVWLAVRIVNRRERWAKPTLAVIVGAPLLYVASFGPACWITSRTNYAAGVIPILYRPVIEYAQIDYSSYRTEGPDMLDRRIFYGSRGFISRYARWWAARGCELRYRALIPDTEDLKKDPTAGLIDEHWDWSVPGASDDDAILPEPRVESDREHSA